MITVSETNDLERLDEIRLLWRCLWRKTPHATFFQSWEWLQLFMRHFGAQKRLRVLTVTVSGRPTGILPLVVRLRPTRLGRVRVLEYPLGKWGHIYGPLGPHPAATLNAAFRHLVESPRDWDVIDLGHVDCDGADRGRTENAFRLLGLRAVKGRGQRTVQIELDSPWSEYWYACGTEQRHAYGKSEARLRARGDVQYVRYRPEGAGCGDDDPNWELYGHMERLRSGPWTGHAERRKRVRQFLRDLHVAGVRAAGVDMNVLLVNRQPVACAYNLRCDDRLTAIRGGWGSNGDADAEAVLLGRMLRDSFRRGDRSLTFAAGETFRAAKWKTTPTAGYRISHYGQLLSRAQLLRLNVHVKGWLAAASRAVPLTLENGIQREDCATAAARSESN